MPVQLPQALSFLQKRGINFKPVTRPPAGPIKKILSMYFSVYTVICSNDVVFVLDSTGIDVDEISCIQRKASNNTWIISFRSADTKQKALALPDLIICDLPVFSGDSENVTFIVKV